jgi:DNA-directed RNA polymerase sigma subunit (sigma70/sigma32)
MGIFDQLESQCEDIAGKVGIPPETVQSMSTSLQQKMSQEGASHTDAIEAVAAEHGVPVEKVQEVLSHCGSEQDVMSGLTSFAGGVLKS